MITDNFKKHTTGVLFFFADEKEAYEKGLPTKGFGSIKYGEGSVYTGEIFFDGKNYNKLGFGKQEFFLSSLGSFNEAAGARRMMYVGEFDYRKTDWIYGNGVMYYGDKTFKPKFFVKGFYSATCKIGDYVGEFDYSSLADGFDKSMESDFDERQCLLLKELRDYDGVCENLFVGDSYFEFWYYKQFAGNRTFRKVFDKRKNINIGLGGSTFEEWKNYEGAVASLAAPRNIIINLGFNDLHTGRTIEEVEKNRDAFTKFLLSTFPAAKLYFTTVVHSPALSGFVGAEDNYNARLAVFARDIGAGIIDYSAAMREERFFDAFDADGIHPSPKGYSILERLVKQALK